MEVVPGFMSNALGDKKNLFFDNSCLEVVCFSKPRRHDLQEGWISHMQLKEMNLTTLVTSDI